MLMCAFSKYGFSSTGRGSWDHAAVVIRDPHSDVPFVLEGNASGITMQPLVERLQQSTENEVLLRKVSHSNQLGDVNAAAATFVSSLGVTKQGGTYTGCPLKQTPCVATYR